MTRVDGTVVRSTTEGLYDDIAPGARVTPGRGFLEFDADLEPWQVAAIKDRMESKDDVDQARRAALRADRDELDPEDGLRRLYDYVLGD